jgi:hypothetical protein
MDTRHLVTGIAVGGACLALSTGAAAETLYGTLTGPGGPNARLLITCERTAARALADNAGSYRITVNGHGRCHLQVNNMPAPGELVFVYEDPTRYDYEVTVVNGLAHIERR